MDGVLVDSEPLHSAYEQILFKKLSIPLTINDSMDFSGIAVRDLWINILSRIDIGLTLDEVLAIDIPGRAAFFASLENFTPIPGVLPLLERLRTRGIPLGVSSTSHRSVVESVIANLKIGDYFSVITSGSDVPRVKPFPDVYLRSAQILGADPAKTIAVEDSNTGLRAARAAGMICIGYASPENKQDLSAADKVIPSYSLFTDELIDSLER